MDSWGVRLTWFDCNSRVNIGNLNSEFGQVSVISEGQAVRNSKAITNIGLLLKSNLGGASRGSAGLPNLFLYKWVVFFKRMIPYMIP